MLPPCRLRGLQHFACVFVCYVTSVCVCVCVYLCVRASYVRSGFTCNHKSSATKLSVSNLCPCAVRSACFGCSPVCFPVLHVLCHVPLQCSQPVGMRCVVCTMAKRANSCARWAGMRVPSQPFRSLPFPSPLSPFTCLAAPVLPSVSHPVVEGLLLHLQSCSSLMYVFCLITHVSSPLPFPKLII